MDPQPRRLLYAEIKRLSRFWYKVLIYDDGHRYSLGTVFGSRRAERKAHRALIQIQRKALWRQQPVIRINPHG